MLTLELPIIVSCLYPRRTSVSISVSPLSLGVFFLIESRSSSKFTNKNIKNTYNLELQAICNVVTYKNLYEDSITYIRYS